MKSLTLFSLLVFFLSLKLLYAQEIQNAPITHDIYLGSNTANKFDKTSNKTVEKTQRQLLLEKEIYRLKNLDDPANIGQIEELNRQLGEESGSFSVKFTPYPGAGVEFVNQENPPFITDNITNIRLYYNPNSIIRGLATFTEQRGANAGRIWVVYAFFANTSSPDSLRWLYSTNNGLSWVAYANGWLSGTDKVNYDDLDMEIIEPSTGNKFLWVTYGLRQSGGTGKWSVGGTILNITTFASGFFTLVWPGDSPSKKYYGVRLTTDNGFYTGNAWAFIICSFDSTNSSNMHINTQKYCRCTNPYTTTPAFSYQGQKFFWFNSSYAAGYQRTLYSDIAYIRHRLHDTVIVSFSGVPDSTIIYFAKADINGIPTIGHGATFQSGAQSSARKEWARISSNGYDNGSVICVFRQYYPNNWNVKFFRTENYGNFYAVGESALFGSTVWNSNQPDIVGLRQKDRHYFAFKSYAPGSDSIHSVGILSSGWTTQIKKLNFISVTGTAQGPKPGFRFVNNDSCFTTFCEGGPFNVWAALGCTGPITGVNESNQVPYSFGLAQNYPNPFNPVTSISFSLPAKEFVTITVYDILGNEVEVLVNEFMNSGSHNISWDASRFASGVYFYRVNAGEFTETKKMVLIK